ncbi:2-hydroxychromene-2-carboxylate isomerase [Limnohabitans sp.]|uniref:2-hydroxychromene-2-carboxylate isomerase n=1 Tax=Limnohabitans sp. TaxID=1907725 RepID=UPI00286F905D|nr:2-hydroxychromene-2-carboxylate isomerase [Limnohabitans sp.]
MSHTLDYYFAPQSPWTYLGHQRVWDLAKQAGATLRVMPVDLGQVFPISGGLPLGKRAPQRQKYRLVELARFSEALNIPLHVEPKFFPVAGDDAARVIIAVDQQHDAQAAMAYTGAVLTAVWAEQRNIADLQVLAELLHEHGLDASCIARAQTPEVQAIYAQNTQSAIDAHVFGAPSYVVDGEMFWGQDRLDFVARKLGV